MDHANAYLIEFSSEAKATTTITSDFTFQDKEATLQRPKLVKTKNQTEFF